MSELLFSPDADRQLTALDHDATRGALWERVNDALDAIEADPAAAAVRRRRYQSPPVWGTPVHSAGDDWLILWAETDRGPLVLYVGEDPR